MKQIPSDNNQTMSDKEELFTDIVSLHHKKRSETILNSWKSPEKLLSIWLQDSQIPTVKAALENINNIELLKNISNSYSTEIINLFKKLLKWQSWRSYQQSWWFFWHIDIWWIILFREKFSKYIHFDDYIKERVFELMRDIDQNKLANKIIKAFSDIDFSDEIKRWFIYHANIQTPIHIDIAIIFARIYWDKIDLSETIIGRQSAILLHLEKAWKNLDIDRITTINDCFGKIISLTNILKKIFLDYLKISYQNATKISNLLEWIDISGEIKEWFLYRIKKMDIVFAKKIKNDYWQWIDFSNEIYKWIDYLKMKWYIDDALKIQKELL